MNKNTLLTRAVATNDYVTLMLLVEEAVRIIEGDEFSLALSHKRESDLREQNKRLQAQIENLEKTLWNRK
jgi:hypothetical protein